MGRLRRLLELRRALALLTAACMLAALALPIWRIVLRAPQYPGRDLPVTAYAYPRLGGEYEEVAALNYYIGFHYPDPVFVEPNYEVADAALATPEWVAFPAVLVVLAVLAGVAALSAASTIARRLKIAFVGTLVVLGTMILWAQLRLYQAGHNLDPDAPMAGVDGFTPPLLGPYEVANISGFSWIAAGGYVIAAGVVFLAVAYRCRNGDATILDVPAIAESRVERLRERVAGGAV
ncbi:hypothetical protein [Halovivax sp.]|uniref:hypothetical protein n=1 Tax=Halovivax sp. TaxID=1935978 RepID=UPI0025BC4677|nr:hypothetical protein [Halovivax sp.]